MIFHHDVMIISVQTDKMAILFLKQLIITFLKYMVSKTALIFLVKRCVGLFCGVYILLLK